jgi:hypothetical protein
MPLELSFPRNAPAITPNLPVFHEPKRYIPDLFDNPVSWQVSQNAAHFAFLGGIWPNIVWLAKTEVFKQLYQKTPPVNAIKIMKSAENNTYGKFFRTDILE